MEKPMVIYHQYLLMVTINLLREERERERERDELFIV
jgi:hypothetical protein